MLPLISIRQPLSAGHSITGASSAGALPPNNVVASSSTNNQELEQTHQVALQLALISAKGSLAFWHPQEYAQISNYNNNLNSPDQDILSLLKSNPHYVKPSITPIFNNHLANGQRKSCSKTGSTTPIKQLVHAEFLAVEGSQIKLNLVIFGQRYAAAAAAGVGSSSTRLMSETIAGETNSLVGQAMSKLSLKWTRNNNENISTTTITSTSSSISRNSRFNQQIINENDMLRQYFGSQQQQTSGNAASSPATKATNFQRQQTSHHHNYRNASLNSKEQTDFLNFGPTHPDYFPQQSRQQSPSNAPGSAQTGLMSFMLAPHVNEQLISKLEKSLQLDSKLLNAINAQIKLAQQQQQQPQRQTTGFNVNSMNAQDDFLAEGQSIDWQKLESYLRHNSAQLKLNLSPLIINNAKLEANQEDTQAYAHQQQQQEHLHNTACLKTLMPNIEQFIVVQVEINQLLMDDGGLYQLEVCGRNIDCQYLSFYLHIARDIPILESKPEHQILEVGDRLTIKCEAASFTLPQITWFLDGQQLNEHQFYGASGGQPSMLDILSSGSQSHGLHLSGVDGGSGSIIIGAGSKLRIGDYVSQNNHVHSFVNSSSVQISDGGFYKCQANNGYHVVEHEARIDVRGLPSINRQLNNLSVLVGQSRLYIQCPYSGYPISAVEWYYRPVSLSSVHEFNERHGKTLFQQQIFNNIVASNDDYGQQVSRNQLRAKRGRLEETDSLASGGYADADMSSVIGPLSNLDADKDPDPDKDEWLSQASAMTQAPNQEDYPEPMQDYPPPELISSNLDFREFDSELGVVDYGDLQMDFQQQKPAKQILSRLDQNDDDLKFIRKRRRKKREATHFGSEWIKFPQSRRHQIHLNGTLVIQDVSRTDQGFYKCRILSPQPSMNSQEFSALNEIGKLQQQQSDQDHTESGTFVVSSNEFYLNTLVAPVISPFSSSESLREGMRNFLTCSVIEGDSPVRLHWLKDNQAIEEYIQRDLALSTGSGSNQAKVEASQARIRVETSNEYTSTLYFSHVDFKDNGNYTCM